MPPDLDGTLRGRLTRVMILLLALNLLLGTRGQLMEFMFDPGTTTEPGPVNCCPFVSHKVEPVALHSWHRRLYTFCNNKRVSGLPGDCCTRGYCDEYCCSCTRPCLA
ncbi:uncharacterized protein [Bemisia tabaci]|uniref:uncharacterized protein n=1 Tax=Bemisia tabaci TaxID=7038 RepID=UPI003B287820